MSEALFKRKVLSWGKIVAGIYALSVKRHFQAEMRVVLCFPRSSRADSADYFTGHYIVTLVNGGNGRKV